MLKSVRQITDDALHQYDLLDKTIVPSKDYIRNFGEAADYIEAHVYTQNGALIHSDYDVKDYRIPGNNKAGLKSLTDTIEFDPGGYIQRMGYTSGLFTIEYNIFRKKIFDSVEKPFFIKEISLDRTEIRLSSNAISNADVETSIIQFLYEFNNSPYYRDFLLNFGENKQVDAVNLALDKNTDVYSILIKLYQPLPAEFALLQTCWINEVLSSSYTFEAELVPEVEEIKPKFLRPANFDIAVHEHKIKPTPYFNLDKVYNKGALAAYQRLLNKLQTESVRINIDYSDYSEFVHFSSAKHRLLNFAGKLSSIEAYQSDLNTLIAIPQYAGSLNVSASMFTLQSNMDETIRNFDEYEAYLYFTSASTTWPRSGSVLAATDSDEVTQWLGSDDYNSPDYGGQMLVAAEYDDQNQDNLIYSVPDYINEDGNNDSYLQFIMMTGQLFDSIWVYIKAIDDLYKANNNMCKGISKDIVYKSLQNLGINLHECNDDIDLYQYYFGIRPQEDIDEETSANITYITNDAPATIEDAHKEIYKRIYHNLPDLLKSKGTVTELRKLCAIYGIPESIIEIMEFGGSDKAQQTIEYSYERFAYALFNSGSSFVKIPWVPLTKSDAEQHKEIVPDAIEFRFKTVPGKLYAPFTLLSNISETSSKPSFGVNVVPAEDGITGVIQLLLSGSTAFATASVSLPIFMTGSEGETSWYNVLLRRRSTQLNENVADAQIYDLYAKNVIDGSIGHQASASILVPTGSALNWAWMNYGGTGSSARSLYLGGTNKNLTAPFYSASSFEGWLQEVRLWAVPLEEWAFDEHVLNPASYAGNSTSGSYNDLAARFQLGSNMRIYDHSITGSVASLHTNYNLPISSGSSLATSFNTAFFVSFSAGINYNPYNEKVYANNANTIYSNPVTEKIRLVANTVTGSVLSPILKLEAIETYSITKDIHVLDASFSPQNEINKDIINHYGNTLNLDNVVGDPQTLYAPAYALLKTINADYYKKYNRKYNYKDYIRTVQFFNNSLFRLFKDNVPGRANLLTGVTIKSPLLERNKIQSVSSSIDNQNNFDAITPLGDAIQGGNYVSHYGDGSDFFTGELSGSLIDYGNAFITGNKNPYTTFNFSGSNAFVHSDFNVLLNNADKGITSRKYRKLDKDNNHVTEKVYLQDGYYNYKRHSIPRYEGSKSTSKEYNVYHPGDASYGKNAAVDVNVDKFAWIVEVNDKNLNFFDKASVYIKYLIDGSGSITELSRQNRNLFEVQNIFKSGTPVGVSMTDVLTPTNQASLDGNKLIWQGGFSYTPIVYREINETMFFTFVNPLLSNAGAPGVKAVASDALEWKTIGDENSDFTTVGRTNTQFTLNGVLQSGIPFSFHSDYSSNWIYPTQIPITTGPYYDVNGNGVYDHPAGTENAPYSTHYYTLDWFLPQDTTAAGAYITADFTGSLDVHDAGGEKYVQWTAPRTSGYTMNFNMPFQFYCAADEDGWAAFMIHAVLEKQVGTNWVYVNKANMTLTNLPTGDKAGIRYDPLHNGIFWDENATSANRYVEGYLSLNNFSIANVQANDVYRFRVYLVEIKSLFIRSWNIDFKIPPGGYFEIFDYKTTPTTTITTGSITAAPDFFTVAADYQTLIFNASASAYYSASYFLPPSAASSNGIADFYSPVEELFSFQTGDIIRFDSYFSYNPAYYEIISIQQPVVNVTNNTTTVLTPLKVTLDRPLTKTVDAQKFAILRQLENETSVILSFNKKNGKTSTGLLIPDNLEKEIAANTSNIVAPLRANLLSNGG